jgi:hypothetical protein
VGGNFRWLEWKHLSRGRVPDQQLQRWQRVYRHQGVQHALVLVQMNNSET